MGGIEKNLSDLIQRVHDFMDGFLPKNALRQQQPVCNVLNRFPHSK
jgi:hypothetical protein